jgi:hypothetical protein
MNFDYQKLEEDISQLLVAMTNLTPSEVAEVEQFLTAGEYGVAFETLCGIIKEEGKPVAQEIRLKFRGLAERMGINPLWWSEIVDGK